MPEFAPGRSAEDAAAAWAAVQALSDEGLLELYGYKPVYGKADYQLQPRVRLRLESEEAVRNLIGAQRKGPSAQQLWREAVRAEFSNEGDLAERLGQRLITIPGRTAGDIVQRLRLLRDKPLPENLMLRQVSARLFWGDSKVLDERADLVALVLGRESPYAETPIQLDVHLSDDSFNAVLMVENPAAFIVACRELQKEPLAILCTHGFKASAQRIRKVHGCAPFYRRMGEATLQAEKRFQDFLFSAQHGALPIFFWGDLDWEGLNILKSIREAFPVARAWQRGYTPMVKLLIEGIGHTPEQADKEGQREVDKTGCEYADSVLREALLSTGLFLDQEVLLGEELQRTDGRGSP